MVHRPGRPRRRRNLHHDAAARPLAAARGEHEHRGSVRQREEQQGGSVSAPIQDVAQTALGRPPRCCAWTPPRLALASPGTLRGTMRGEADGGCARWWWWRLITEVESVTRNDK